MTGLILDLNVFLPTSSCRWPMIYSMIPSSARYCSLSLLDYRLIEARDPTNIWALIQLIEMGLKEEPELVENNQDEVNRKHFILSWGLSVRRESVLNEESVTIPIYRMLSCLFSLKMEMKEMMKNCRR